MKKSKFGKAVNWFLTILVLVLAVFVVFKVVYARIKGEPVYLFDYMFLVVVSDSMEPELMVGDFIVAQKVPIETVHVGDNAVFTASAGSAISGKNVVHKVINAKWEAEGNGSKFYLTTQGIKAGTTPDEPFGADRFLGKQVWHSAAIGKIIVFFSYWVNWVFLAVVVVLLWLIVKLLKYISKTLKGGRAELDGKEKE